MYSGTGVCAGHAHWQSTTLWKTSGSRMSVGSTALPPLLAGRWCRPSLARPSLAPNRAPVMLRHGRAGHLMNRTVQHIYRTGRYNIVRMSSPPSSKAAARPAASPGRPKDLAKRAAILQAAERMFLQHGFEGVSMDQIAAAAGVSKLTVYSHFGDKDAL